MKRYLTMLAYSVCFLLITGTAFYIFHAVTGWLFELIGLDPNGLIAGMIISLAILLVMTGMIEAMEWRGKRRVP